VEKGEEEAGDFRQGKWQVKSLERRETPCQRALQEMVMLMLQTIYNKAMGP